MFLKVILVTYKIIRVFFMMLFFQWVQVYGGIIDEAMLLYVKCLQSNYASELAHGLRVPDRLSNFSSCKRLPEKYMAGINEYKKK